MLRTSNFRVSANLFLTHYFEVPVKRLKSQSEVYYEKYSVSITCFRNFHEGDTAFVLCNPETAFR